MVLCKPKSKEDKNLFLEFFCELIPPFRCHGSVDGMCIAVCECVLKDDVVVLVGQ